MAFLEQLAAYKTLKNNKFVVGKSYALAEEEKG